MTSPSVFRVCPAVLVCCLLLYQSANAAGVRNPYVFPGPDKEKDWRAFENGSLGVSVGKGDRRALPKHYNYQEGLTRFRLNRDVYLETVTVAREREGDPSEHIITRRSRDGGRTWTGWTDLEPEGPPMSQYGWFIRHPRTGRVYYVYNMGYDRALPLLPGGERYRAAPDRGKPWPHLHAIGRIACRLVNQDGSFSSKRWFLKLPRREIDRTNIYKGKYTFVYSKPSPRVLRGADGLGWYTKLGPYPITSTGEAFVVVFKGWRDNDRLEELPLELLPHGKHGIRDPNSKCITDFKHVHISGEEMYFIYRTTAGYVGLAQSRDGGKTFKAGPLRYAPGQGVVKNPQGPCLVFEDSRGRKWLSYYNAGFDPEHEYGCRDLVFLSPIRVVNRGILVGQPELLGYRLDQKGYKGVDERLNCPRFKVRKDGVIARISDKKMLRDYRIPHALLDILAGQHLHRGVPETGLLVHHAEPSATIPAPELGNPGNGDGFTLCFTLTSVPEAGAVLIDGQGASGRGIKVHAGTNRSVVFSMKDAKHSVIAQSDPGSLSGKGPKQVAIIVDGEPDLISMVVNGRLQDGGDKRVRGTVWFNHGMGKPHGTKKWKIQDSVEDLRVYSRFLLTTEVIGLHRSGTEH